MSRTRTLRPRTALRALLVGCVAAVALPAVPAFASCRGANVSPTSAASIRVARSATLCLLNEQRARHGLRRLRSHPMLQNAAQQYATAMVAGAFFGHVSPSGSTLEQRIRQGTHYLARALRYVIGENLAWGQGERGTPREIVSAWMHSPGHRANILRAAFREIGIGIVPGAPVAGLSGSAATYANEFGRRG